MEQTLRDLVRCVDGLIAAIEPVLERISLLSASGVEATLFLAKQLEAVATRLVCDHRSISATFLADDHELCRWFAMRRARRSAPRP